MVKSHMLLCTAPGQEPVPGLDTIEIPLKTHHLKQFQNLKNGYVTHSSLSLFRCSVKCST